MLRAAFICLAGEMLGGALLILLSLPRVGAVLAASLRHFAVKPEGRWDAGAYLTAKELCLSLEPASPAKDDTSTVLVNSRKQSA